MGAGDPDYIVTNDTEWTGVMSNSAATLAGKIIELRGDSFTELLIQNKNIDANGSPLVVRGGPGGAKAIRFRLNGTVTGIDFAGIEFQMTGWPRTYASTGRFDGGSYDNIRFFDCAFRHGYGAELEDFDTGADLPEYERIDNVQTATTASTTYALTWKDPAATGGWVEFFNRGSQVVHAAFGGPGVTAASGDLESILVRGGVSPASIQPQTHTLRLSARQARARSILAPKSA